MIKFIFVLRLMMIGCRSNSSALISRLLKRSYTRLEIIFFQGVSPLFSLEHLMNLIPKESPRKCGFIDGTKNQIMQTFLY